MRSALFSALYPAALPYLGAFLASVRAQTDRDFDLWLSLDGVTQAEVGTHLGGLAANFIQVTGLSVAAARDVCLQQLASSYDQIILVDSDDLLLPERVARAKAGLRKADVYGCALELINAASEILPGTFGLNGASADWQTFLTRANVFGLSNTAYRAETLTECLGLAEDVRLVDWLLVTRALQTNARLSFDPEPQMRYRQYEDNTAKVLGPYQAEDILRATELVLGHFRQLQTDGLGPAFEARLTDLLSFQEVMADDVKLTRYTNRLNRLKRVFWWWEAVAHPDLTSLWS